MSNAVGYTRLSQESDTSIERQKRNIRAMADELCLDLLEIADDGERSSGFEEDRSEYQRVRDLVTDGRVEAVLVNDKRRLARDFDATMRLILDLRENDVTVHTHEDGRLDLSDPTSVAIELVKAAAEHEAKLKEIERARAAVRERIQAGKYQGRPRYGTKFDEEKERLIPDPDEYETVKRVLDAAEDGKSYREIAARTDVPKSTVGRIISRKEFYEAL